MYNPDDLPKSKTGKHANKEGRQEHHGTHELIASNAQDVLDVQCFAGKAPIEFWDETDDDQVVKKLYWRQHYNVQTSELSVCHP